MPLTGKELVRKAQRDGWIVSRIRGSHYVLTKGGKTVVVPVHAGKTLPQGFCNKPADSLGLNR